MSGLSRDTIIKVILVAGMLVSGSVNTISKKIQNQSTAEGLDGKEKAFAKPWTQTAVMLLGELFCLAGYYVTVYRQKIRESRIAEERREKLLYSSRGDLGPVATPKSSPFIFLAPVCCDIAGTTLAGIGLILVDASIWQMLRGSIVLFTALLSKIFLRRKLFGFHALGLAVVFAGLGVVGASSLLNNSSGSSGFDGKAVLGLALVVAGQLCNAVQMVVEEMYLKNRNIAPLKVVGMEGFFGLIIMIFIILPVLYFIPGKDGGRYENSLEAFKMMSENGVLMAMVLLYLSSIAFYNFCGLSVAKRISAVVRTLVDALRTIVVWACSLIIFYSGAEDYGEAWTVWSWMQLGGFALLVTGTLIYNSIVRVPGFSYPAEHFPLAAVNSSAINADSDDSDEPKPY